MNWFTNPFKAKTVPPPRSEEYEPILSVEFFINEQGELDLRISSVDDDPQMAKLLGHMLFIITTRNANNKILAYFEELVNTYPERQQFIQQVIGEWSHQINKTQADNNEPVVGPMDFLSNIKKDLGST